MKNIDVINLNNCVIKDEKGLPLAKLVEEGDHILILSYLRELGWEVR